MEVKAHQVEETCTKPYQDPGRQPLFFFNPWGARHYSRGGQSLGNLMVTCLLQNQWEFDLTKGTPQNHGKTNQTKRKTTKQKPTPKQKPSQNRRNPLSKQ